MYAERLAARAVLARAASLVGPVRAARELVREPLREPYDGELDVEASLENLLGKRFPEDGDLDRHAPRRAPSSGRAHGRHVALDVGREHGDRRGGRRRPGAQAAPRGPLGRRVRGQGARRSRGCMPRDAPEEVVARMLDQPVRGYTNIAAALELGAAELERGRNPRRSGLLITRRRRHRRAATRCRSRTASPGSSCCSPRTTRWTPTCAAVWPTPAAATSSRCAATATCRPASSTSPTGCFADVATASGAGLSGSAVDSPP